MVILPWARQRFEAQEKVGFCRYIIIGKAETPYEGHLGCEAFPNKDGETRGGVWREGKKVARQVSKRSCLCINGYITLCINKTTSPIGMKYPTDPRVKFL